MVTAVAAVAERNDAAHTVPNIQENFALDVAVADTLPPRTKILGAFNYGSSAGTITVRIETEMQDGSEKRWFLKCAAGEHGRYICEGEYHSMTEMCKLVPTIGPKPHAHGSFRNPDPPTYFFIGDFIDMENDPPEVVQFTEMLAELHIKSESPTGQFGFYFPVCHGPLSQPTEWDPSWCSYFTKLFEDAARRDREVNEPWPEFDALVITTLQQVIPRLVGVLEIDGRSVKPTLIHGDLWEGNSGTHVTSGKIHIFDAGSYYAHHEMELAMWRCKRHALKAPRYRRAYFQRNPPSEPKTEADDHNRLYSIREDLVHSTCHKGAPERQHAFENMSWLIEKYLKGKEATDPGALEASAGIKRVTSLDT